MRWCYWLHAELSLTFWLCVSVSLLQCGAGLQAAGGQAAAADDEALPYAGRPLRLPALPPGGLHLHPKTQVQSWLQEARSLETLVPVKTRNRQPHPPLMHRIYASVWPSKFVFVYPSSSVFLQTWCRMESATAGYWESPVRDDRICNGTRVRIPWKILNVMLTKKRIQSYFWTNFFKQGVKLHQGNIFGDQRGEKTNLISLRLFAYIFLADVYGVLFYDDGSVTVTFLFTC